MATAEDDKLKTAYEQLCDSYHKIDDFRTKLLGFLPLVSGVGIFFLVNGNIPPELFVFLLPIGIFGVVVTLGLFCYELYGIKKCHAVIEAGRQVERQMGVNGHFITRPREITIAHERIRINEPFAAGLIYPAVLAAWTFLALMPVPRLEVPGLQQVALKVPGSYVPAGVVAFVVFVIGLIGSIKYNNHLRKRTTDKSNWIKEISQVGQCRNTLYRSDSKIGRLYDPQKIKLEMDSKKEAVQDKVLKSICKVLGDEDLERIVAMDPILKAIIVEKTTKDINLEKGPACIIITDEDLVVERENLLHDSGKHTRERINERRKIQKEILQMKGHEMQTALLMFNDGVFAIIDSAVIASSEFVNLSILSSYKKQNLGILGMTQGTTDDITFLDPLWIWYETPTMEERER